jgi:hypothetical protein
VCQRRLGSYPCPSGVAGRGKRRDAALRCSRRPSSAQIRVRLELTENLTSAFTISRMPMRLQKPVSRLPNEKLLRTYVLEAGRLRELATSVTTPRVRARLLEEAANQELLAEQAKRGVFQPPAGPAGNLHLASPDLR